METWKSVPTWDHRYEVSDHGRVRNKRTGRILKASGRRSGGAYKQVRLQDSALGRNEYRAVHALVADAFIGPRPFGYIVNHKDGVKTNNCAENLEYATPQQNTAHAIAIGCFNPTETSNRQPKGANNCRARFTWEEVDQMRHAASSGVSRKDIMAEYRIAKGHLSQILNFRIYCDEYR